MSDPLLNLSPLDGRYFEKLESLRPWCSEYGLCKMRVLVETRWFQCLSKEKQIGDLPAFSPSVHSFLEKTIDGFSLIEAKQIKSIEKRVNHDVKAVEYFLKKQWKKQKALLPYLEFIHWGCTSEDINNLAYALIFKKVRDDILLPAIKAIIQFLKGSALSYAEQPMLSRTHGQAASPTTLGKEWMNVVQRLERQYHGIQAVKIMGKMNGAVGNFNAHTTAYPDADWLKIAKQFVESLGLSWQSHTTQIEPHDYLAELLDALVRTHVILIDFTRDTWAYISLGYFKQKSVKQEVGSSTMPHKINPIDFENAEGNLSLANAILSFLSQRLPVSRWQRDLVDSTLLRNLGVGLGHSLLACQTLLKGMHKLEINREKIESDLNNSWEVLTEAVQTVMRRYHIPKAYEKLKILSRGKPLTEEHLKKFIQSLPLPEIEKNRLLKLSPLTYTGLAAQLAKHSS